MIRGLLTFVSGIVLLVILNIFSFVTGLITGIILAIIQIPPTEPIALGIVSIVVFLVIALPYSLLTTFFLYKGVISLNTKKYGILGGPLTTGILCWFFNVFSLPYYLLSKKFPVEYVVEPEPIEGIDRKFITGWFIGLIIVIAFTLFSLSGQLK